MGYGRLRRFTMLKMIFLVTLSILKTHIINDNHQLVAKMIREPPYQVTYGEAGWRKALCRGRERLLITEALHDDQIMAARRRPATRGRRSAACRPYRRARRREVSRLQRICYHLASAFIIAKIQAIITSPQPDPMMATFLRFWLRLISNALASILFLIPHAHRRRPEQHGEYEGAVSHRRRRNREHRQQSQTHRTLRADKRRHRAEVSASNAAPCTAARKITPRLPMPHGGIARLFL